jgi:hypothetical protein
MQLLSDHFSAADSLNNIPEKATPSCEHFEKFSAVL